MPRMTPRKKRRKSRWSSGSLPPKNKYKKKVDSPLLNQCIDDANSNSVDANFSRSSRSSSKASEMSSSSSVRKSSGCETNISNDVVDDKLVDERSEKEVEKEAQVVTELMEDLKAQVEEDFSSSETIEVNRL